MDRTALRAGKTEEAWLQAEPAKSQILVKSLSTIPRRAERYPVGGDGVRSNEPSTRYVQNKSS